MRVTRRRRKASATLISFGPELRDRMFGGTGALVVASTSISSRGLEPMTAMTIS